MIRTGTHTLAGLGILALALGGAIALEATTGVSPTDRPATSETPVAGKVIQNRVAAADQTGRLLSEILARPVFSPDRRPVASNTARTNGLSRLTGIVVSGTQKVAIFAGPPGSRPTAAQEGERVGAYEVREITRAGVTVLGPEGVMVVSPVFDPAAPPAAAAKSSLPARGTKTAK